MRSLILFIVLAGISISTDAWACSCLSKSSIKQSFDNARSVFTAKVFGFKKSKQGYVEKVILEVDKVWKGRLDGKSIAVNLNEQCAYHLFEENIKYIVYAVSSFAKRIPDSYHVSFCGRTKPLDEGRLETRYLDALLANKDTKTVNKSLLDIIINEKESKSNRAEAARIIGGLLLQNPEDVPKGAIEILINTQSNNAEAAGLVGDLILSSIKDVPEGTIEVLLRATKSNNVDFKVAIVKNLSYLRAQGKADSVDVNETLLRLLKDDNQNVRNAAVEALGISLNKKESDTFEVLVQELNKVKLKQWNNKKLYENTLVAFGISISRTANTQKEKVEAVKILHNMIDEVSHRNKKVSIIEYLGYQEEMATWTAPKLLEVLNATDDSHIKSRTISALGRIKAMEALEIIKSYLKDENCYVAMYTISAVHNIAPESFPEYFRNKAMPEMIKRFESCWVALTWTLEALGSDAKDMKPFLIKKYKDKRHSIWRKDDLKNIIDKLQ